MWHKTQQKALWLKKNQKRYIQHLPEEYVETRVAEKNTEHNKSRDGERTDVAPKNDSIQEDTKTR